MGHNLPTRAPSVTHLDLHGHREAAGCRGTGGVRGSAKHLRNPSSEVGARGRCADGGHDGVRAACSWGGVGDSSWVAPSGIGADVIGAGDCQDTLHDSIHQDGCTGPDVS